MFARLFEHPVSLAILVLLIVVLLGWKKLPDMARSLGRSSRILKSEIDEMKTESRSKASNETVQGESVNRTEEGTQTTHNEGSTRSERPNNDI